MTVSQSATTVRGGADVWPVGGDNESHGSQQGMSKLQGTPVPQWTDEVVLLPSTFVSITLLLHPLWGWGGPPHGGLQQAPWHFPLLLEFCPCWVLN